MRGPLNGPRISFGTRLMGPGSHCGSECVRGPAKAMRQRPGYTKPEMVFVLSSQGFLDERKKNLRI